MKRTIFNAILLLFIVFNINAQPLAFDNATFSFDEWKTRAVPGIFGGTNVQDGINVGLSLSTPVNSANKVVPFGFMLDANYLHQTRRIMAFGFATGYGSYFGEDNNDHWGPINKEAEFRYIPVAGAVRYALENGIVFGGDLGYAFGLHSNWDGGLYIRPIFGFNISEITQLNVSYTSISKSWTWSAVNIGCTFNLNK
ncbi:conserved hypothetical protein [Formosa agariphila KMM 3901]|uniref:Outer membrane protein beta-barrel domain-containing protein n=1 Tax=Formosa agariphila (strain DSM 15362 / KCTC 12365 / LMG 23005 / KMM 3901 / M-2Alg 35-1) TaxID=1347342 RepID=T2KKM9_FORAG|nr:hypothetical protein [Formosa agariphila]CDF79442.1 conserved hypothetical protein [Formosa agariphila KMM 3901]